MFYNVEFCGSDRGWDVYWWRADGTPGYRHFNPRQRVLRSYFINCLIAAGYHQGSLTDWLRVEA